MIDTLLFLLEVAAIVLCSGLLFLYGLYLVLLAREKQFQDDHALWLAQQRLDFVQPEWVQIREAKFLRGKPLWKLIKPFTVRYRGRWWIVPEGEETDGASNPRWLWSITGYLPDGKQRAAAVGHDWLCKVRPAWCSWLDAADMFRHYQRLANVEPENIVISYMGVVVFGPKWLRKARS